MIKKRYVWFANIKKTKKNKKKYEQNIKQKEVEVLVTDLSYYILLENSGVIQRYEAKKDLYDGKT